jgi:hypothetical protein
MVDNWFFGSIFYKITVVFPTDGQGLLQHDKDRSEGEYHCIKLSWRRLIGLLRIFTLLQELPSPG